MALTQAEAKRLGMKVFEAGFKLMNDPKTTFRISDDGSVAVLSIPSAPRKGSESNVYMGFTLVISEQPLPVDDSLTRFAIWFDQLMAEQP